MTWGWRAELPIDATASGTTGGGGIGGVQESKTSHAWPQYEAEYLKRALTSERHKYNTRGLDEQQKGVYLDHVTKDYIGEADQCLKAEFEQWLEGRHDCNDPEANQEYLNAEGRPVRRWVYRTQDDGEGNSKVGQARAGWKHTPWGRAALTGLPGVRNYLRGQVDRATEDDIKMQLLAEHGPHDLESSWQYFKHWVKGRPLTDAVALPANFEHPGEGSRSDFGTNQPQRMYAYDSDPPDHQPGVLASDRNASNAAVQKVGEYPIPLATEADDAALLEMRQLKDVLRNEVKSLDDMAAQWEERSRENEAEARDVTFNATETLADSKLEQKQQDRQEAAKAPALRVLPAFS